MVSHSFKANYVMESLGLVLKSPIMCSHVFECKFVLVQLGYFGEIRHGNSYFERKISH